MTWDSKDSAHAWSAYAQHDVTTFEEDGSAENIKKLISQKRNMNFGWNKKILKPCHKDYIFRHRFLAEVTFKGTLTLVVFDPVRSGLLLYSPITIKSARHVIASRKSDNFCMKIISNSLDFNMFINPFVTRRYFRNFQSKRN